VPLHDEIGSWLPKETDQDALFGYLVLPLFEVSSVVPVVREVSPQPVLPIMIGTGSGIDTQAF
jgi:hypothetical protein